MVASYINNFVTMLLLAAAQHVAASPADASYSSNIGGAKADSSGDAGNRTTRVTGGSMTWIGDNTGTTTKCGAAYQDDGWFVAVHSDVLNCKTPATGTTIGITCNGKTLGAAAVDECADCAKSQIKVQTKVWEFCGFSTADNGPQPVDFGIATTLQANVGEWQRQH